jgi:sulfopyruvate decarboxylase subunit alpha
MDLPKDTPEYAKTFLEGLKEAGVSIVAALPESLLGSVYRLLRQQNEIRYVQVTNESELPGICVGAYLGGKKAVMIMENSGLRQGLEPIARFAYSHHLPVTMIMAFRGEWGERNWWGHNHAQTMEPILNALRIPYRFVREIAEIKPAIKRALLHADGSQWPVALAMTGNCVEVPAYAKD